MQGPHLQWAMRSPHPALRHLIHRYCGYKFDAGQSPKVLLPHRDIPTPRVVLMISLREPYQILDTADPAQRPRRMAGAVNGLHLGHTLVGNDGHESGVHVELSPLGAVALLGVSAPELADQYTELADLPVPWASSISERLVEQPDWDARFRLLDAELLAGLRPYALPAEVEWAWQRIMTNKGDQRISQVAAEVGWSRQFLSKRFSSHAGLAPKQIARLNRFERSAAWLRAGHRSWSEIATAAGYYDQAHLSKEWRALAGCSPSEWLSEPDLYYDVVATLLGTSTAGDIELPDRLLSGLVAV